METEGGGESQTPKTLFGVIIPALAGGAALNFLGLTMVSTLPIAGLIVGHLGSLSVAYGLSRFPGCQMFLGFLAYAALVVAVSVYWLRFPVERGLIVTVLTCAVCIGLATGGADMVLKVSKILKQRCRN